MNQTDGCTNCTVEKETTQTTTKIPTVNTTSNVRETATRKRRQPKGVVNSLLTRTHFYHILMDKFTRFVFHDQNLIFSHSTLLSLK